jgi:hypothetical protein
MHSCRLHCCAPGQTMLPLDHDTPPTLSSAWPNHLNGCRLHYRAPSQIVPKDVLIILPFLTRAQLWYQMMWTRVPYLPKGFDNYRFGGGATNRSGFRTTCSEPHNRSTTSPSVINRGCTVDLAKKANPCLRIEEHKQEQGRLQDKCTWMIKLTKLGSHKPTSGETVLDRIDLRKTQTLKVGGSYLIKTQGSWNDPWLHP